MPEKASTLSPQLLTEEQVAEMTGLAMSTLRNWRSKKLTNGPPAVKIGFSVRYRVEDVRQWLAALPSTGTAA